MYPIGHIETVVEYGYKRMQIVEFDGCDERWRIEEIQFELGNHLSIPIIVAIILVCFGYCWILWIRGDHVTFELPVKLLQTQGLEIVQRHDKVAFVHVEQILGRAEFDICEPFDEACMIQDILVVAVVATILAKQYWRD
jgi:hypothetical protein